MPEITRPVPNTKDLSKVQRMLPHDLPVNSIYADMRANGSTSVHVDLSPRSMMARNIGGEEFSDEHFGDEVGYQRRSASSAPEMSDSISGTSASMTERFVGKAAPIQVIARSITDNLERDIDARIVRLDEGVLDQPQFAEQLRDILQAARQLIREIGVSKVVELIIHAHSRMVYNRYGHRVLDGYVLQCTSDANARPLCEIDFGQHCVVVPLQNSSVRSVDENNTKSLATNILLAGADLKSFNQTSKVQRQFYDESYLDDAYFSFDKYVKKDLKTPKRPKSGGTQKVTDISDVAKKVGNEKPKNHPTVAYNGEMMVMQGFEPGVGPVYDILTQNHSVDATRILQKKLREQSWTVAHCYRSSAYDACMTHGARSCIQLACSVANTLSARVVTCASQKSKTDDDQPNNYRRAHVKAFAPLTFITPIFTHDDDGNALTPTFLIHVNTYGEFDLARAISQEMYSSTHGRLIKMSNTRSRYDREEESGHEAIHSLAEAMDCRGFALLNSAIGNCVVMRQVEPRASMVYPYWLTASSRDLEIAAHETMQNMRSIHPSTFDHPSVDNNGYPSRGVFDAQMEERNPTVFSGPVKLNDQQARACYLVSRGYLQPHQFSRHYISLASPLTSGPLFSLWSKAFPQAPGVMRRFAADTPCDVLIKYCGGLNGSCVNLELLPIIRSKEDYVRIPPANIKFYGDVMHMALCFYQYCKHVGKDAREVFTQDVLERTSFLAENSNVRSDQMWSVLTGGAVAVDERDAPVLWVDMAWMRFCLPLMANNEPASGR